MIKKILITGSSGFVGKNLYLFLNKKYRLHLWNKNNIDLLDTEKVTKLLKKNRYDVVLHCATYDAAPRFSDKKKELVYSNNMKMFNNLVNNNEYFGQMFYFGSGAERLADKNDYSISKIEMNEKIHKETKLSNICNLRLFCVYGPHADWRYRVVNNMCCKAVLNLPITVPENRTSDFLHINDLAQIVEKLFSKKTKYRDYDICSGEKIQYKQIAQMIQFYCANSEIIYSDINEKGDYFGDNSKLLEEIGNFHFTSIDIGIKKLITYYKNLKTKIDKNLFEY